MIWVIGKTKVGRLVNRKARRYAVTIYGKQRITGSLGVKTSLPVTWTTCTHVPLSGLLIFVRRVNRGLKCCMPYQAFMHHDIEIIWYRSDSEESELNIVFGILEIFKLCQCEHPQLDCADSIPFLVKFIVSSPLPLSILLCLWFHSMISSYSVYS